MEVRPQFAGDLGFISLADTFQILGSNHSTGILYIKSPHVESPGIIYFENGNPVNASIGSLYGLDAVYALFGWAEGTFEFRNERVYAGRVIEQNRMQIVLDALRMLDDGLIRRVGPEQDISEELEDKKQSPLVIRRSFVDYLYVIDEEEIPDGAALVDEGAHGKWIWVVLEGTVKITRETSTGPMTIAQLGEGCFIGSITSFLFSDYVRSATVRAVGNVRMGLLDSQRLHEEYSMLSPDFKGLLLSLAGRLRKVSDRAVELSENDPRTGEAALDKKAIIKQGSGVNEVFSIMNGETYVIGETSNGRIPLVTLKKGDFLGRVPFLDMGHEPRSATVLGSDDLELRLIDVGRLQQEFDGLSGTLKSLIEHSCNAVAVTTRLIYKMHEGHRTDP
ncbi:MAG: cyclic nucleotide-binding domain-containing protein [Desulfatiglandales bacterium]